MLSLDVSKGEGNGDCKHSLGRGRMCKDVQEGDTKIYIPEEGPRWKMEDGRWKMEEEWLFIDTIRY